MKSATQQPDKRYNLWMLASVFLQGLALIGILTSLLLINWKNLSLTNTWNISDRKANRYDISSVTIDSSGNSWFIAQLYGDNKYELRYVAPERIESWDLPPLSYSEIVFASIAKDKNNNPWLILGNRLAHWDGKQWTFISTPYNAEIKSFICPSVIVKDFLVWGIDNAEKSTRIIKLDLSHEPIQAEEILLPEGMVSYESRIDCIISSETNLLAIMSDKEQVVFYQLQNDQWYEITSFKKKQPSILFVNDVSIDPKGQIWVVLNSWIEGKHIGKYNPATNTWSWLDVEHQPELEDRLFEYGHIAVDDFDRVWLSASQNKPFKQTITIAPGKQIEASYTFETYAVGVYEEQGDKLVEIQHYTSENSTLETSQLSKMVIGPDEKIWTWNRELVWMDTRQMELPNPMPAWFVLLTEIQWMIACGVTSLVLMSLVLVIRVTILKRRHSSFAQ